MLSFIARKSESTEEHCKVSFYVIGPNGGGGGVEVGGRCWGVGHSLCAHQLEMPVD